MKSLLVPILSVFLFTACSKSDSASTTQHKLAGKWTLKSWTETRISGSQSSTSTGNYKPGEYIQFETDGTCYFRIDETVTKTSWKLVDDEKSVYFEPAGSLDLSDEGYLISSLTESQLVLSATDGSGSSKTTVNINLFK